MLKTFLFGILLGIAAAVGALYSVPAVDQHREVSIVAVAPNGGNRESFYINIPADRVMVGAAGQSSGVPAGLKWPQEDILADVSTEIFKIRNAESAVIGVAARTEAKEDSADTIDWIIHLPARGSIFVRMEPQAEEGGQRVGRLRAGSQEFDDLAGILAERWVADTPGEIDAPIGRIELTANYVGTANPDQTDDLEALE